MGLNNQWYIDTRNDLAITYSDKHVLENMHLAKAFALIKRPEFNFLEKVSAQTQNYIRRVVIEMVLGTDMSYHNNHLGKIDRLIDEINKAKIEEMVRASSAASAHAAS